MNSSRLCIVTQREAGVILDSFYITIMNRFFHAPGVPTGGIHSVTERVGSSANYRSEVANC